MDHTLLEAMTSSPRKAFLEYNTQKVANFAQKMQEWLNVSTIETNRMGSWKGLKLIVIMKGNLRVVNLKIWINGAVKIARGSINMSLQIYKSQLVT